MKIIYLTHAEAADPAVVENVRAILAGEVEVSGTPRTIQPEDNPATGVDIPNVVDAAAAFGHTHGAEQAAAAQAFGHAPQLPTGAPSIAGAGQSLTAPVVPQPGQTVPTAPTTIAQPAANVAPPAPTASPANPAGVEVDRHGLPWDARIHGTPAKKNADGSWRARRGLNDGALVARVEAELRALVNVPAAVVPSAPAVPVAPLTPATVPAVPPTPPAPPVVAAPPAPPPVAALPAGETFPQFMQRLAPFTVTGQITQDQIQAAGIQVGVTLTQLQTRPDYIPRFAEALGLPATPTA